LQKIQKSTERMCLWTIKSWLNGFSNNIRWWLLRKLGKFEERHKIKCKISETCIWLKLCLELEKCTNSQFRILCKLCLKVQWQLKHIIMFIQICLELWSQFESKIKFGLSIKVWIAKIPVVIWTILYSLKLSVFKFFHGRGSRLDVIRWILQKYFSWGLILFIFIK